MSTLRSAKVSLQELIALNDEILALVRAKLPLPKSLRIVGRDVPGKVGGLLDAIGEDMENGLSLEQALERRQDRLPASYVAIVAAGVSAGRLPTALECIASTGQYLADVRRSINAAMLYPVIVLICSYTVFIGFVYAVARPVADTFQAFRLRTTSVISLMEAMQSTLALWWWIPPAVLLLLLLLWMRTARSGSLDAGSGNILLRAVPGLGAILRNLHLSSYSHLLMTMVDSQVPLPLALRLAGSASGGALARASEQLAAHLESGKPLDSVEWAAKSEFPPLLTWSLTAGQHMGNLPLALKHASDAYRQRGLRAVYQLRITLPAILLLMMGVSAVAVVAVLVFVPMIQLWQGIGDPTL